MSTAYDTVIYPSLCHPQSHPDRLAVTANLFGIDPAPPDQCRVLEIGCGDGSNLLPLAAMFPRSRFFGFDLAKTRVEAGREDIASLGLTNLELAHADIRAFTTQGEPFDYIIAHGIYSWIPPEAREKLLAICRARLAPNGVAYVSYNCLPGSHIRRMTREIMCFHTRKVEDPMQKASQAMAVCHFIANSLKEPDTYRQLFKDQLEQIAKLKPAFLLHDDLAENNDAFYFHEFVGYASGHGLQYLGEAEFYEMQDDGFTSEARQILALMEDSRLSREQYLDFIKCRRFRQTLLVHAEAPVRYPAVPEAIERFHISSPARLSAAGQTPDGQPIERFAHPRGTGLQVSHPVGIRLLRLLSENWPATLTFSDLFAAVTEAVPKLGQPEYRNGASVATTPADGLPKPSDQGPLDGDQTALKKELLHILLQAYRAGVVEFRRTPLRCARKLSARPAASRFARWQVTRSSTVTTLRGENLRVEDQTAKHLLLLLDGTRTLDELETAMVHEPGAALKPDEVKAVGEDSGNGSSIKKRLIGRLEELAAFALLES